MTGHWDPETLAELADGTLPPEAATEVRKHLAACRSCMGAYASAVRYRAAWLAKPELFTATIPAIDESGRISPLGERGGMGRTWRLWVAASMAATFAIVAGSLWSSSAHHTPTLGFTLPPAVRAASEWSSSRGLVLPGGERLADQPAPAYRSGYAELPPGLEHEVDSLIAVYERGIRTSKIAVRVVQGLLAMDDLDAARNYAREGLSRWSGDVALLTSAADVDYRASDLRAAEGLLREALGRAPHDPVVALDLALVLRQQGNVGESAALLDRAAKGPSPPVAARARRELRSH